MVILFSMTSILSSMLLVSAVNRALISLSSENSNGIRRKLLLLLRLPFFSQKNLVHEKLLKLEMESCLHNFIQRRLSHLHFFVLLQSISCLVRGKIISSMAQRKIFSIGCYFSVSSFMLLFFSFRNIKLYAYNRLDLDLFHLNVKHVALELGLLNRKFLFCMIFT